MALIWKTSATIANISYQPLVGTVDVVEVEFAIVTVPKAGYMGEDGIKEAVDKDTKVSSRR